MATAHVNIGSNIGDRHAHIERAVACMSAAIAPGGLRRSDYVESEAWGYESENRFLNLGVCFEWGGSAEELMGKLLEVQASICADSHRDSEGNYVDRVIDIDLIAVGEQVVRTDGLTLPHPRMQERDFVLRPIAQLDPGWRHPESGLTVVEMLGRLSVGK